jgi:uncharacterized surface protein with fasciclin (FAS1) repeats
MKKNSFIGRYRSFFLFAALLSGTMLSCKEKDSDIPKPDSVADIILRNEDFSIFREIVQYAKMSDGLRSSNITLFLPNNAAFRSSNITSSGAFTSQPIDSAVAFVNKHVLADKKRAYFYKDLPKGEQKSVNGFAINIAPASAIDTTLRINQAIVILKNVNAANGVIHVVDRTLTLKR